MKTWTQKIPLIMEHDRTPLVDQLVDIINEQNKRLDLLTNEIRRLKDLKTKPKLKPSKLRDSEKQAQKESRKTNRNKSEKHSRTKPINRIEIIKAENIPADARFKGYRNYKVQELVIRVENVLYKLERWQLSDGSYVVAKLPPEISDSHFGTVLKAYALHQYHHQCVTQPLLLAQLREWGFSISNGQLSRLLIDNKANFHKEKDAILKTGLSAISYIHTDDTGARHDGKNGYCTHIGNELFAWFKSTNSKSRINFLELLRMEDEDYYLNKESFAYMKRYKVAPWIQDKLKLYTNRKFDNKSAWENCLNYAGIKNKHYVRLVTEAALIGSILQNGLSKEIIIVSDDAGQFNVFEHALCWIHAERGITTLIPSNPMQIDTIEWARKEIWGIYHLLIDYKKNQCNELKSKIIKQFNEFCKTKTDYQTLNLVLKRMLANKNELLMALKRPDTPLHNNLSECDIREYVKRRKISGSTRSDNGRQCRDTFASLKKTALKLKVSFWDYLVDRIAQKNQISWLPDLIIQVASAST
jgi:hypothetical protein